MHNMFDSRHVLAMHPVSGIQRGSTVSLRALLDQLELEWLHVIANHKAAPATITIIITVQLQFHSLATDGDRNGAA